MFDKFYWLSNSTRDRHVKLWRREMISHMTVSCYDNSFSIIAHKRLVIRCVHAALLIVRALRAISTLVWAGRQGVQYLE